LTCCFDEKRWEEIPEPQRVKIKENPVVHFEMPHDTRELQSIPRNFHARQPG
jgi:hypothetical protein